MAEKIPERLSTCTDFPHSQQYVYIHHHHRISINRQFDRTFFWLVTIPSSYLSWNIPPTVPAVTFRSLSRSLLGSGKPPCPPHPICRPRYLSTGSAQPLPYLTLPYLLPSPSSSYSPHQTFFFLLFSIGSRSHRYPKLDPPCSFSQSFIHSFILCRGKFKPPPPLHIRRLTGGGREGVMIRYVAGVV